MKVLFVGGTGVISSACSQLAVRRGIDLYLLCRGRTTRRPAPEEATVLRGDIREPGSAERALEGCGDFDAVVDWVAFTPEHVETDLELFAGRARQYVFISSASAYHSPPPNLPVTESAPLANPHWAYARQKIACEERLRRASRHDGVPITIVRPSHTYDQTMLPVHGGYAVIERMRAGRPIVVHGDGTSLWTLTHHRDFARGFVPLLGNPHATGETFHITSDEALTWNQIYLALARAAGAPDPEFAHVPSEVIARFDAEWGAGLLGDKAHSMIFDNAKIKRLVPSFEARIPFARGAEEMLAWHDADPARQTVDEETGRLMDELIAAVASVRPDSVNEQGL